MSWFFQVLEAAAQLSPAVTGTFLKYWTGSTWTSKPLKRWNGSSWQDATLKRWNGSSWVTV